MSDRINPYYLLIGYGICCLIHIVSGFYSFETIQTISKVALMPWLIGFVNFGVSGLESHLKKSLSLALLFSWLGDICLLKSADHELFFISGLVLFLIAHLFYISIFRFFSKNSDNKILFNSISLIIILVYVLFLLLHLYTFVKGILFPAICIYAAVIGYMLLTSLRIPHQSGELYSILVVIGSISFVISDSILALNKFTEIGITPNQAVIYVMISYCLAQFLLTIGITHHSLNRSKA